ncbi:MAG TPA: hypothetical protein VML54_14915, partial [Candidatus Limnocylindrales bacterium]|nr:hypothetical protein [Candidatus Limnocylindrales bacterium]
SPAAAEVFSYLERRGASFLADLVRATGRLPSEVENALWELVAAGLVTGDGVAGLRTLLLPEEKRRPRRQLRSLPGRSSKRLAPAGRWSVLPPEAASGRGPEESADGAARRLLARWGVVLREVTGRERRLPPWRSILQALRRMEARGEVRGGRFVQGFVGEQFALPRAVDALRAVRRSRDAEEVVIVSAADPLNLVGLLTPGAKVPVLSGQVIAFRDGVPVEVGDLAAVRSKLQSPRAAV